MNRKLIAGSLVIAAFAFAGFLWKAALPDVQAQVVSDVACTMDAKICPDGSYVGRVPPSCQFAACPTPAPIPGPIEVSDEIQLNNLKVQSVSQGTGGTATIVAVQDIGVNCKVFDGSAGCASLLRAPEMTYQIQVDSQTRLMLRERQAAAIASFEAGDSINVYGFRIHRGFITGGFVEPIDALIVRNLSKPARVQPVQLNNVEVIDAPLSLVTPTVMTVLRRADGTCTDGTTRQIACPVGAELFIGRKYDVLITASTQLLLRTRARARLSDFQQGDKVNIYGVMAPDGTSIRAQVIRNLSKPVQGSGLVIDRIIPSSGPIGTKVTIFGRGFEKSTLNTVKFGSGYVRNLTPITANQMEFTVPASLDLCVSGAQVCAFAAIPVTPGTYPVSFLNSSGASNTANFTVTAGAPGPMVHITNPNGGEVLRLIPGNGVTIRWRSVDITSPNATAVISLVGSDGGSAGVIASGINPNQGQYEWTFSNPIIIQGDIASDLKVGKYKVNVTIYNGTPCLGLCQTFAPVPVIASDESDNFFALVEGNPGHNQPPVVQGLSGPTFVYLGRTATWKVEASDSDRNALSYNVDWGDSSVGGNIQSGSAAPGQSNPNQAVTFTHSYARAGTYTITFTVTDSEGLSAKATATVNVLASEPVAGSINLNTITPSSGPVGTVVTLRGSGFTATDNHIKFQTGYIHGLSSSDGATLSFVIPPSVDLCAPGSDVCALGLPRITPGVYNVSVINAKGISNSLVFTVTSAGGDPLPPPANGQSFQLKVGTSATLPGSAGTITYRTFNPQPCLTSLRITCAPVIYLTLVTSEAVGNLEFVPNSTQWSNGYLISVGPLFDVTTGVITLTITRSDFPPATTNSSVATQ